VGAIELWYRAVTDYSGSPKYYETKEQIEALKKNIWERQAESRVLDNQVNKIVGKLSETVKGAKKVNEHLQGRILKK
jgi:wobble nucleotide-excising tRNase